MSDLDLDLLPDDDSLVRTAIRGLRVPAHHPDFWDQLAWQLDDAADEMAQQGLMEEAPPSALLEPELAEPEPRPHHVEDPWTDTEEAAVAAHAAAVATHEPPPVVPAVEHPPRREPLRATTRVFVEAPSAPAAGRVRHDPAVVPRSLRSASNAVLLAVVVVAAVVALLAGLALVRSRSDAGSPSPSTVVSQTPTTTPSGAAAAHR
jgi:hypothetical protein